MEEIGQRMGKDEVRSKRPFVWTQILKKRFVDVYNQLGHSNATPKKILELMNEPGLTDKNVNSHLQKYRDHLRKLGVIPEQKRYKKRSCVSGQDQNVVPLNGFDLQTLSAQSLTQFQAAGLAPVKDQRSILNFGDGAITFSTFGDGYGQMMMNNGSTQMNGVPTGLEPNHQSTGVWPGKNYQDRNFVPLSARSLTQFEISAGLVQPSLTEPRMSVSHLMDQRSIFNFENETITYGDGDRQMMMNNGIAQMLNSVPAGMEPNQFASSQYMRAQDQSPGVWPGQNVQSGGMLLPIADQPSMQTNHLMDTVYNSIFRETNRRLSQTEDQNSALPRNSFPVASSKENSFVLPALYQEDQNLVSLNEFDLQDLPSQSLTQFQATGLVPVMDQGSILNIENPKITSEDGDRLMMNNSVPTGIGPNQCASSQYMPVQDQSIGVWPRPYVQSSGVLLPVANQPSMLPSLTTDSIIIIDDDDEDVTLEPEKKKKPSEDDQPSILPSLITDSIIIIDDDVTLQPKKKKPRVECQSEELSNVLKGLEETKEKDGVASEEDHNKEEKKENVAEERKGNDHVTLEDLGVNVTVEYFCF